MTLETTLSLLIQDDKILLALKKRGFGSGKFNGIGGKIQNGETPEEAMVRETKEEINVTPTKYEKVGEILFDEYYQGQKTNILMHVYKVNEWIGNPCETEEMSPRWFNINTIPYAKMLPDDFYWLPLILKGEKISAYFNFDEEWNLLSKNIDENTSLN